MKVKFQLLILSLVTLVVVALTFFIYDLVYPLKYENLIISASLNYSVEPEIIASVINAESSFNENATSSKGAIGLMQVMPTTAKELAKELKLSTENFYDPEINITLGTFYLSKLFSYFNDLNLVICAYNAGPNKVKAWLNDKQFSSDGKTLSKIPYKETEEYLKKVVKNIKFYQNRFN